MNLILMLLPLALILFLLVRKVHMLVAGLAGGVLAIIVSWILVATGALQNGLTPLEINNLIVNGALRTMLSSYLAPVVYAAAALMIARSGSIKALIEGLKRLLKGNLSYLAAAIVLVQGLATYMAGLGAGNTMVIAPLMAAAVGFLPEVVAAMAIATAVGFTTSPASTETALAATAAEMEVGAFANMMLPFTIVMYLLAAGLAFWAVYKKGNLLRQGEKVVNEFEKTSTKELWFKVIPALTFLFVVVLGSTINSLLPFPLLLPIINVLLVAVLVVVFGKAKPNEVGQNLIEGSQFILTTLFGVGIFLGFINMVGFLGTFSELAAMAGSAPQWIVVVAACVFAFIIAIPSGAFAAGVLTLILPTLSLLGTLSPLAFGLIAISVGLGTQISPVQINVAALANGFKISTFDVIKGNMKYVVAAAGIIAVVALVVGFF
jgi:hypothetical protein